MIPNRQRRLIDRAPVIARRADLTGDILPADSGRDLVPWEEREALANRFPPVVNINFPRIGSDEESPGSMVWEKRSLQREPNIEADFLLPVLQAFGVASALLILSALAALAFDWTWHVPAVAFGLALAYMLVARLRFMDSLLWSVETLTGYDVNGDGKVGEPAAFTLANPAQARQAAAIAEATTESEAHKAELLAFVHRCYTVGTGERSHGVRASGSDREAYVRQRDVLLSLGIARWKHDGRPRAGWVMAVSHQKALQIIARHVL